MKKCFLHIGFHKTASSSFQETLKASCDILTQQNLVPISFSRIHSKSGKLLNQGQNLFNHSQPLGTLFKKSPQNFQMNKTVGLYSAKDIKYCQKIYFAELGKYLSANTNILISGEAISLFNRDEIKDLCALIKCNGFQVIPLALVRSPYQSMCSSIQERVKAGHFYELIKFNNFPVNLDQCIVPTNSKKISKIISIFGDSMNFFPFSEACKHSKGPVGFLFEFMGVKDQRSLIFKNSNESKSNFWTRVQNHYNLLVPRFVNNQINPSFQCMKDIWLDQGKFMLTEREFKVVEKLVNSENETILSLLKDHEYLDVSIKYSDDINAEDIVNNFISLFSR